MAKFCNDEHSCDKDGFTKVVKDGVIAKLFLNDFRRNPDLMPQAMQQTLEDRYDLVVTHNQCRKAKGKALKMIQDEDDEQFARFRDYETELLRTNPESTIELGTVAGVEGVDLFDRFYVNSWQPLEEMQTISSIQLLGAVVQVENTDNWVWFIAKLKADLGIGDGEGFTLIPDRQKGLLIVVDQELPKIEHRMCARHIYGNLTRVHPGRAIMKKIFWKIAKAYTVAEYDEGIEEMRQYVLGVYETLMEKNPQTCSRAYFTGTACYEVVHNNFSETYNNTINTAREMPLVEMLETIRRLAMVRTDFRKEKMKKHKGKYSKKVAKTIEEESKHKNNGRAVAGANGQFDVRENNLGHSGHMTRRTYWYLTSKWRATYENSISPVTGMRFWRKTDETRIQPPTRPESKGRKKKQKRIKGKNESPKKKRKVQCGEESPKKLKASREGRTMTCGHCGITDWYLTSKWRATYENSISPVTGMRFWRKTDETRIQPPTRPESKGRKKKQKRIKGKNESPKKKRKVQCGEESPKKLKASREGRTMTCGHCGITGHNAFKCPNIGASVYRKPKKKHIVTRRRAKPRITGISFDGVKL
ncbi:hypothetical protein F2Q69_00041206 [Brassica cretica]|uniref:CCHC-type domain-containing protein n=1 Tax=Brassica cretica TaxID=69181 RepID=A0A8S9NJ36_BRACR|nr:hypothetical protein F2Q69_00041206 [Brassica cretica]